MATTNRGFAVNHQKVSIELDFSGRLRGHTELTISPTRPDLRTVYLHAREFDILSVRHPSTPLQAQSTPLDFTYLPQPPPVTVSDPKNLRLFPEAKRRLYEIINAADEGELAIAIDTSRVRRVIRGSSTTPRLDGATPAVDTPAPARDGAREKEVEYDPITILIEYEIKDGGSGEGISVVEPTNAEPDRIPHIFTNSSTATAARSWVPCVDSLHERCTWEFEFVVPRALTLGAQDEVDAAGGTGATEKREFPVLVVGSGELLEQAIHPHTSRKSVWHFSQSVATSVQHIAWAVGPFEMLNLTASVTGGEGSDAGDPEGADGKAGGRRDDDEREGSVGGGSERRLDVASLHAFCLPGRKAELINSVSFARSALDFYNETFGSYPFSSYKMVFLDLLGTPTCSGSIFNGATVTIFPSDLLHPSSIIDQAYETRPTIAQALAAQWSGINIIPKTWSDVWLTQGLSLYIAGLFLRHLWGNNEWRFRLKKDVQRCVALDFRLPPLSTPGMPTAPDADLMPFINLKAPLVLYILDKHLRKSGTSLGLSRVIPKLFLSAISGELRDNTLSTTSFLRMCRKVAGGGDLRAWADQWIFSGGCPHFTASANFNRKKMMVELSIKQESKAKWYYENVATEEERTILKPNPLFDGQMTIRIHEADGTPYEHVIEIREAFKKHDLLFNTKYKRVRRNTKRFQARQAAEVAAAQGDVDAVEDLGMMDMSFAYPPWEQPKERERWRVADWTEEDDQTMSQSTYEWCRIDAEFEWLATLSFEQPDFMWLEQLQRDRDVVAQLEAIQAVTRIPSPIVSSHLCRAVLVTSYYFRVRMEAALALVSCATSKHDFIGLFHLLKLFQTRYCYEPQTHSADPAKLRCVPLPTDFSNLPEYFIRKALLTAISQARGPDLQSFPNVHRFFSDQLAYNDNSANPFSDAHYLSALIGAISNCLVNVALPEQSELFGAATDPMRDAPLLKNILAELDRCSSLDQLVPSYQNAITVAVIECKLKMMLAALIPADFVFFLGCTREGNHSAVRIAAFDALLLLKGFQDKAIVRYMFIVLRDDTCLLVRRRLAQGLIEVMPILVSTADLGREDEDSKGFEEDLGEQASKGKGPIDHRNVFKSLRHEVGRAVILRECISAVMLAPNVDPAVQICLIKMAEILLKPQDEKVPKVRLRMPTNTTLFQPDLPATGLPRVKLSIPGQGAIRTETPASPPKESPRLVLKPKPTEQIFDLLSMGKKAKPPKTPKLQKFQAAGMDMTDYKVCGKILKKLVALPISIPFRVAVDPIRDLAPDYFNIVSQPMDLGTIGQKLENGHYPDRHAFYSDLNLIVSNCELYNRADSPMVLRHALPFKANFEKQWARSEKTLESLKAKTAVVKIPPPPPSNVPRPAPPPSFAAFAAQPAPAASSAVTGTSEARPGGPLKLTIKSRPSDVGVSPSSAMPPPSAKPIRIKFGGSAASTPVAPSAYVDSPASYFDGFSVPGAEPTAAPLSEAGPKSAPKSIKLKRTPTGDSHASSGSGPSTASQKQRERVRAGSDADDVPLAQLQPNERRSSTLSAADSVHEHVDPGPPPVAGEVELDEGTDEPLNQKKAKTILRRMNESEAGVWFRVPVDPVALGIPTYFQEIPHPMDLGTMTKKLDQGKYKKESQIFGDFNLIVRNCVKFNGLLSAAGMAAEALGALWKAEWRKAHRIGYQEKRSLLSLISRLQKVPGCGVFAEPVDVVALAIPDYHRVIGGAENARDLGSIKAKLDADGYETVDEVEADLRQMLRNCFAFNPMDSPVYAIGKDVEKVLDPGIIKVRKDAGLPTAGGTKRKTEGGGGVPKKVRLA